LGAFPTGRYLESLGIEVTLGGVGWERIVYDPKPGPRSLDEVIGVERISVTTGLANGGTQTSYGVVFQCSNMARFLGKKTLLVDITKGVRGIVRGLRETVKRMDMDFIVGVDVGGDVLAQGGEVGLRSPLADTMMLAALHQVDVPTITAVFAPSCDGELTTEEILERISRIAERGGYLGAKGLTPEDVEVMSEALKYVKTEASMLPLLAWRGKRGVVEIRGGERKVNLSILSTLTFYFDTDVVHSLSSLASKVADTESLEEANERLHEVGITTEYDYELQYASRHGNPD
ncbi:MAG: DUF1152 domain-containing protein, partial [Candidatus Freyarchaeota archaeon]|nr:DUF1152 domain-containing protein [Candidatus Jordarchaeia archaeon]